MMSSDQKFQRRKRSKETVTAITYQLEYVVEQCNIELMLLSDEQGFLIAQSGPEHICRLFAAFAPKLAKGAAPDAALLEVMPDLKEEQILVEKVHLEDIPLYLTAVMTPDMESVKGYERARSGIERIYRTT